MTPTPPRTPRVKPVGAETTAADEFLSPSGSEQALQALQAVVKAAQQKLGRPKQAGRTTAAQGEAKRLPTPPTQPLPSLRLGLTMSDSVGELWKRGTGMRGGEDLAMGSGSSRVWLPRGDHSTLSPRSSLRNSSSLTLAVALVREHQRRIGSSRDASAQASSETVGSVASQTSFGGWLAESKDTDVGGGVSAPRLVWRANSGSRDSGFGYDTAVLAGRQGQQRSGLVTSEQSRERLEAARTIVTERQAASRQGKRTADARAGLKSPRMPAPPRDQAFEVVRHTVPRDPAAAMRLRHKMASPTAPKLAHTVR